MIKTIFFDFDGVLTTDASGSQTTCKNIQKVLPNVTYDHILQCYRQNHLNLLLGHCVHTDIWQNFCACVGVNINIDILCEAFKATPANAKMFELSKALKANYRLGIITDNSKDRFRIVKKEMQLSNTFHYFIISGEIGSRKDSETNFNEALRLSDSRPEECIFIDNNPSNLIVPAKLGFNTIHHDHNLNDLDALKSKLKTLGIEPT